VNEYYLCTTVNLFQPCQTNDVQTGQKKGEFATSAGIIIALSSLKTMTPDNHPADLPERKDDRRKNEDLQIKKNPNPRANENIPEKDKNEKPAETEGVGSEVTDGEDG
jgi:hypothetical protein